MLCTLCMIDLIVQATVPDADWPAHEHHHGYPPVLPCLYCFFSFHEACDPQRFWCACLEIGEHDDGRLVSQRAP